MVQSHFYQFLIQVFVVYSLDIKNKKYNDSDILDLIKKNNPKYEIQKILKLSSFKLSSSNLRNYYHKNILAFGDLLHKIHPLAGQGFNMTIRDIKILSEIIDDKIASPKNSNCCDEYKVEAKIFFFLIV